jgi:hypothetical protein
MEPLELLAPTTALPCSRDRTWQGYVLLDFASMALSLPDAESLRADAMSPQYPSANPLTWSHQLRHPSVQEKPSLPDSLRCGTDDFGDCLYWTTAQFVRGKWSIAPILNCVT